MTPAAARGSFVAMLFTLAVLSQGVRGEVFEVPLPEAMGLYSLYDWKDVTIDLGFPLSGIRDVRFRVEGTGVAAVVSGPFNPGRRDAVFAIHLHRDAGGPVSAYGPGAGLATYPEPEPFAGEASFGAPAEWNFLQDGAARGTVALWPAGSVDYESWVTGGSGTITGAWLIIDATAVPEPGLASLGAAGLWGMSRRRRRR